MSSTLPPVSPIPAGADLHSPQRQLIDLLMAHADLNALIDDVSSHSPLLQDDLRLRRMKKRRLALRDQIAVLQAALQPKEPA